MEFDATLKEFFQQQPTNLLLELTGGVPVVEFLKVELRRVQERRLDLVLLLEAVHRSPMAGLSNPRFAANDSVPADACRSWVLPLRATLGALHQAFGKDLLPIMPGTPQRGGWPLAHSPSPRLARDTGGATPVHENGGWAEIHMAPEICASTRPNVEDRTGEPKEAASLIDIQFSKNISGRLTMDFSKISAAVADLASRSPDPNRAS